MDKVQKYNSFNTNTPSSESYRNYLKYIIIFIMWYLVKHRDNYTFMFRWCAIICNSNSSMDSV